MDVVRRRKKQRELPDEAAISDIDDAETSLAEGLDGAHYRDDILRLLFICVHPELPATQQIALALRIVCGLSVPQIARAFLVSESAMEQRITRAKARIADAKVPYEVPRGTELEARLTSVLEVIYLIFNEGYSATAGDDWVRPGLCEDALRLGRILAELAPEEPEVHGLLALMELHGSRAAARVGADGDPILLPDQDRGRWDQLMIGRGLAALSRAEELGGAGGWYALQAAISACHARARRAEDTDWARIAELYGALGTLTPSPVVELNRAVAVSMANGPAAGLELVDRLAAEPALRDYHLLPTVRGDLLAKLGRHGEAVTEFERAAEMTRNERERELLHRRAGDSRRASSTNDGSTN